MYQLLARAYGPLTVAMRMPFVVGYRVSPMRNQHNQTDFSGKGRALVMAIVNVTPDSFFPASRATAGAAENLREHVRAAERDGVDILDFGAESTRPGSLYVDEAEELKRLIPAIRIAREVTRLPISVDTRKARVAEAALDVGADIVNDISSLRDDDRMAAVVAERQVPIVLMHMAGTPVSMQNAPHYDNVVEEVREFLMRRAEFAAKAGISRIVLDPGIGFGKTVAHNLSLLKGLSRFVDSGFPVLVGHSRKGFIGKVLGYESSDPEDRFIGSIGVAAWSVIQGARIIRTHDVKATREIITMIEAIETSEVLPYADNKPGNRPH